MKSIIRVIAAGPLVVATPALADKIFAVTPSGAAEMLFPRGSADTVNKLSSKCIDVGWTVISSTSTELVCESPMSTMQSVLGQALMGNSYSTPPRRFFRFNVAQVNGVSRVQASGWIELQMAFGQTKRTDFSGPEFHNGIMTFMGAAGGKFPSGTTFPNHVMLGMVASYVPLSGGYKGMHVDKLDADGAAVKAGIREGDVVTSIAGKRLKGADDYLDAAARAAAKATYTVEFTHDGKSVTTTVERQFRPTITEAVVAAADADTKGSGAEPSRPSVADELNKLLKLREAGVLTGDEFDAQKRRLLAN